MNKVRSIWTGVAAFILGSALVVYAAVPINKVGSGLTLTSAKVLNNNLITGLSGGQTVIGGTAASNVLTLQSTTSATRGVVRSNDDVVVGPGSLASLAGRGLLIDASAEATPRAALEMKGVQSSDSALSALETYNGSTRVGRILVNRNINDTSAGMQFIVANSGVEDTGLSISPLRSVGIGTSQPNLQGLSRALTVSAGVTGDVTSSLELQGARTSNNSFGTIAFYHKANLVAQMFAERTASSDTTALIKFQTATSGTLFTALQVQGPTITLSDTTNFAINTATGTKFGTATTQKIGFWNATPVVQPTAVADAAGGATVDAECRTAVNALLARMRTVGFLAP